jgi:hypothetical protein
MIFELAILFEAATSLALERMPCQMLPPMHAALRTRSFTRLLERGFACFPGQRDRSDARRTASDVGDAVFRGEHSD